MMTFSSPAGWNDPPDSCILQEPSARAWRPTLLVVTRRERTYVVYAETVQIHFHVVHSESPLHVHSLMPESFDS